MHRFLIVLAIIMLMGCRGGLKKEEAPAPDLLPFANPMVGTDSRYEFSNGNTYPAITMPWGMTCWTPQTAEKMSDGWIYHYHKVRVYKYSYW
jgi:putative alpha-1,2-mannosidase